jgi:hypothetical protein
MTPALAVDPHCRLPCGLVDSHRSFFQDAADESAHQSERGGSDPGYAPPVHHYGDNSSHRDVPAQAEPRFRYPPVEARSPYATPAESPYATPAESPYATPADPGGPRSADGASVLAMPVGPRSGEQLPPLSAVSEPGAEPTSPTFAFGAEHPGTMYPSGPAASAPVPSAFAAAPVPPGFAPVPVPPAYAPEPPPAFASAPVLPAFAPGPPTAPGMVHPAPTSGLPYVAGPAAASPAGRAPLTGDPRPGSAGSSWNGFDAAEETQVVRRQSEPMDRAPSHPAEPMDRAPSHPAEPMDRAALRRPSGGSGTLGDGVYRSRRPGLAAAIVAITVVFELMALRLLGSAFFASGVQVGGSIASSFLVLGLPMFGFGLYGLLSGAAAAPGSDLRVWLRPPLVYLPVALVLFVTAGLAAA